MKPRSLRTRAVTKAQEGGPGTRPHRTEEASKAHGEIVDGDFATNALITVSGERLCEDALAVRPQFSTRAPRSGCSLAKLPN
jgi:hypothetical protein